MKKEEWMSNSTDLSPMDYGPNRNFDGLMFWKKSKDLISLKRSARLVWKNFPSLYMLQRFEVLEKDYGILAKKAGLSDG
jgi:hypothetical protein